MKKFFAALLCSAVAVSLVACGVNNNASSVSASSKESVVKEETTTPIPTKEVSQEPTPTPEVEITVDESTSEIDTQEISFGNFKCDIPSGWAEQGDYYISRDDLYVTSFIDATLDTSFDSQDEAERIETAELLCDLATAKLNDVEIVDKGETTVSGFNGYYSEVIYDNAGDAYKQITYTIWDDDGNVAIIYCTTTADGDWKNFKEAINTVGLR